MRQVFFRAIVCALAGFLAWAVTEPFAPTQLPLDPNVPVKSNESMLILLIGGLVGLAAGVAHGLARGSRRHVIESGVLGLIFGAIGSTFGSQIGVVLVNMMMSVPNGGIAYMDMPGRMIARALALLPIGVCMGFAIGLTLKSKRGMMAGLLGGMIGGIFVGFGFDTISGLLEPLSTAMTSSVEVQAGFQRETGGPGRAILGTGLGLAVGLFVAIIDRVTRQAWVRLVLGRNEGKEWPVDNDRTMIGRDERAHVPLFGDMNVQPLHAVIEKRGSQYVLIDQNTPIGVGYENQRVSEAVLNNGACFQVGSHNLQFLMKDGAAQHTGEGRAYGVNVNQSGPVQPQQIQPIQQPGQQIPQPMPQQPVMGNQTVAVQTQQPQQVMGLALVVTGGPMTGTRFALTAPMEAGREAPGITLGFDTQASRRHAAFTPMGDTVGVQDLGSTNGTFVNGQRVQSATLNRGDVVQIGNSTFRVE